MLNYTDILIPHKILTLGNALEAAQTTLYDYLLPISLREPTVFSTSSAKKPSKSTPSALFDSPPPCQRVALSFPAMSIKSLFANSGEQWQKAVPISGLRK